MGTNIYGELVRAQLQNSASDLTPSVSGLIYFNALEGVKWYSGAAWRTAADLNSSQVLSNKDIDGGVASDTSRLTLPKGATATLQGLTRKQGTLWFSSDENKVFADTGASLVELASSGSSYRVVTANDSVANGDKVFADATAGSFTLTLPASPLLGYEIEIIDPTDSWSSNAVTLDRNGNNIDSVADDLVLDIQVKKIKLVYFDATVGWLVDVTA